MKQWISTSIAYLWNRLRSWRGRPRLTGGLDLGIRVRDGEATRTHVTIAHSRRPEHIAILGKTGTGKTSLMEHLCWQDIEAERGFAAFDLHGDLSYFIQRVAADRERRTGKDFREKLVVINPADPEYSVGLNPLELHRGDDRFVRIAEFAEVLKQRWHLHTFGARTDELLRNSLYALADNDLTLVELMPFLSSANFRAWCLRQVKNPEVRSYFELRFDQASEAMQAVMREPILNKTSAFTADPHFRHIVGQAKSTVSLLEAMDAGCWLVFHFEKGELGEEAATLHALFFTGIKNALFSRKRRDLFTLYCDEMQNLVAYGSELETVFAEARKFGVSVVSANQFLEQYPPAMRAAILAAGSHVFFRLSSSDANEIGAALDGGRALSERLKNLPMRHLIVKSGEHRLEEAVVPHVAVPKADEHDLYERSRSRWARSRAEVERDISLRQQAAAESAEEDPDAWE